MGNKECYLKDARGRGTLGKEKPPVFGMIQRYGKVVIQMLANVRQTTIEPSIKTTVLPGTLIYTDEYGIYARLDCVNPRLFYEWFQALFFEMYVTFA